MSRFPFARYPNGWFQIAYSDELPSGGVLPLRYFGRDLVLFRTEGGAAQLLDAHCPHLGAHLGHGGKVEGECVRCPFHAWQFNGRGECTSIPYAGKIPPKARIRPWELREVNGMIMTFYHGEGQAPSWEPIEAPEYTSDEWARYERRQWTIKTHNQEMAENAVDTVSVLDLIQDRVVMRLHLFRQISGDAVTHHLSLYWTTGKSQGSDSAAERNPIPHSHP